MTAIRVQSAAVRCPGAIRRAERLTFSGYGVYLKDSVVLCRLATVDEGTTILMVEARMPAGGGA